jgi:hypothetical protein
MPQLVAPLDDILGSLSKVRLLRLLISEHRVVSAREAARLVGMSAPAILQAAEGLVMLGLAVREEGGHQVRVHSNEDHALLPLLRSLFAAEDAWAATLFDALRDGIGPGGGEAHSSWSPLLAAGPVVAACVFGSMARGEDRPGSDLDLLVLTRTTGDLEVVRERIAEHAPTWRRSFGVTVSPVVMAVDRARNQHAAGDPLLLQAARDARMIIGAAPLLDLLTGAVAAPPIGKPEE